MANLISKLATEETIRYIALWAWVPVLAGSTTIYIGAGSLGDAAVIIWVVGVALQLFAGYLRFFVSENIDKIPL